MLPFLCKISNSLKSKLTLWFTSVLMRSKLLKQVSALRWNEANHIHKKISSVFRGDEFLGRFFSLLFEIGFCKATQHIPALTRQLSSELNVGIRYSEGHFTADIWKKHSCCSVLTEVNSRQLRHRDLQCSETGATASLWAATVKNSSVNTPRTTRN